MSSKKNKKKESEKRPVLVLDYDPRLPAIQQIQNKHWRSMRNQDQYLSKVFKEPPMTAFRRENNLRSLLIRSKVPEVPKIHEERKIKGMKQCGNACPACPYILEGKHIRINKNKKWTLNNKFTCETFNIVYMIECQKDQCKMRYIGQTQRGLKYRLAEHRGYVNNNDVSKSTGSHFNLPGHSQADLKISVIEKVKKKDKSYRETREEYHINQFNTYYEGLNRQN